MISKKFLLITKDKSLLVYTLVVSDHYLNAIGQLLSTLFLSLKINKVFFKSVHMINFMIWYNGRYNPCMMKRLLCTMKHAHYKLLKMLWLHSIKWNLLKLSKVPPRKDKLRFKLLQNNKIYKLLVKKYYSC